MRLEIVFFLMFVSFCEAAVTPETADPTCKSEIEQQTRLWEEHGWVWDKLTEPQKTLLNRILDAYQSDGTLLNDENSRQVAGCEHNRVVGSGNFRPTGDQRHRRYFDSPQHFWVCFSVAAIRRHWLLSRQFKARDQIMTADESAQLRRLRRFSIFDIIFSPGEGRDRYEAPFLSYLRHRVTQVRSTYVYRAVQHLEHYGEIVGVENCKRILGITYDQLTGGDYYGEGKPGEHFAIFRDAASFYIDYSKEVDKRRQFKNEHVLKFTIFDVQFRAKRNGAVREDVEAMFNKHRPIKQRLVIDEELDILQTRGVLIMAQNCGYGDGANDIFPLLFNQVMGNDSYALIANAETGKPGQFYYRRYFDNAFEHWMLFDDRRQARIRSWPIPAVRANETRRSVPTQDQQLARLEGFTFFDVTFNSRQGEMPEAFSERRESHRQIVRDRVVQLAATRYLEDGTLLSRTNCSTIVNMPWERLVGKLIGGRPRANRVFDSPRAFWEAFDNYVRRQAFNRDLSETQRGRATSFRVGPILQQYSR